MSAVSNLKKVTRDDKDDNDHIIIVKIIPRLIKLIQLLFCGRKWKANDVSIYVCECS